MGQVYKPEPPANRSFLPYLYQHWLLFDFHSSIPTLFFSIFYIMHSSLSTSTLAGREYDNGALRLVTLLGSGAYGSVYSAHDCHPSVSNPAGKAVLRAVKCIEQRDEERILMEIIYHRSVCEHPNILTIHRTFEDAYTQFIVLDLCPDGDLFSAITQDHLFEGNNALLKAGFLQVVDAVEHCHDHGVFHRDLKPENLLCYDQGSRLVLTDFGLATNVLSSKDFGLGSQQYMSPGASYFFISPSSNVN